MAAVSEPAEPSEITIELEPDELQAFELAAEEMGMTIADVVRIGLAGFVRRVAEGQQSPAPTAELGEELEEELDGAADTIDAPGSSEFELPADLFEPEESEVEPEPSEFELPADLELPPLLTPTEIEP